MALVSKQDTSSTTTNSVPGEDSLVSQAVGNQAARVYGEARISETSSPGRPPTASPAAVLDKPSGSGQAQLSRRAPQQGQERQHSFPLECTSNLGLRGGLRDIQKLGELSLLQLIICFEIPGNAFRYASWSGSRRHYISYVAVQLFSKTVDQCDVEIVEISTSSFPFICSWQIYFPLCTVCFHQNHVQIDLSKLNPLKMLAASNLLSSSGGISQTTIIHEYIQVHQNTSLVNKT